MVVDDSEREKVREQQTNKTTSFRGKKKANAHDTTICGKTNSQKILNQTVQSTTTTTSMNSEDSSYRGLKDENERLRLELATLKANNNNISTISSNHDDSLEQQRSFTLMEDEGEIHSIRRDMSYEEQTFMKQVTDRAGWLVGLMVLQSMSSFIIAHNEELLQDHSVIVQFLTMLVGAGGNAGNQASVRVIRGLALGTIDRSNTKHFLRNELILGLWLSIILSIAGFIRALAFFTPLQETLAITSSLFVIVATSVLIGSLLPLAMKAVGIDPAHSSTTIQVIMDILGVLITVHISSWIFDLNFNNERR